MYDEAGEIEHILINVHEIEPDSLLEDLVDGLIIDANEDGETIPWEEVKKKLDKKWSQKEPTR